MPLGQWLANWPACFLTKILKERHCCDADMKPYVGHIIRDYSQDRAVTTDKTQNGHQSIDKTEHTKEISCYVLVD
jgi:hypothetical protein